MTDNEREATKLFYDVFKHITTLATGTIVILTTFIGTVFKHPILPCLVVTTFVGMLIALITAVMTMAQLASHLGRGGDDKGIATAVVYVCYGSFVGATASLAVFAVANFTYGAG